MCAVSNYDAVLAFLDRMPTFDEVEPAPRGVRVFQGPERRLYVMPRPKGGVAVKVGYCLQHARRLPADQLRLMIEVGMVKAAARQKVAA